MESILKGENPCLTREMLVNEGIVPAVPTVEDAEFGNIDRSKIRCRVKLDGEWISSPLDYPPQVDTTSNFIEFQLSPKKEDTDHASSEFLVV